ncbi:MAG: hypothetical protein WAV16_00580 [Candidatus Moraniibacteriota bacterium]
MQNKILLGVMVACLVGVFVFYQQNSNVTSQEDKQAEVVAKKVAEKAPVKKEESAVASSEAASNFDESKIVYYYGAECPHCKDVLAYLDEKDIYTKVDFTKKEVWHDKKNGEELVQAALKCGLDPSKIGVPFVFSQGKCFMGGPDVMNFFGEKAGIEK